MNQPTLAVCNFIPDSAELKRFAVRHGFAGVDWTFKLEDMPGSPDEESRLQKEIAGLAPLEIRYHCAFNGLDLGDADDARAAVAMESFRKAFRMVSRFGGKFATIHLGLGLESAEGLSWERTLAALGDLAGYAEGLGVQLCLENLAWGWTSRPELFEKLIRKSGAGITLDIGHARASHSVQSRLYVLEDFVSPYPTAVFNAHVYHEERDGRHLPPGKLEDIVDRLFLLSSLPACEWWVIELREEAPLLAALAAVREFFDTRPETPESIHSWWATGGRQPGGD